MNSRDNRQDDAPDRDGAANARPEDDRAGPVDVENDVQATLAAWREGGSQAFDPVRFRFIESLAERATACDGPARELLDARIRGLVDGYRDDLLAAGSAAGRGDQADALGAEPAAGVAATETATEALRAEPAAEATATDAIADVAATGHAAQDATGAAGFPDATLATLLAYIAGRVPAQSADPVDREAAARRAAYPEIPDLDYFKKAWSLVSSDTQLRQSSEQVHENAGPLNSSRLVHQSLLLMRELSPGYLHQFLSYTDALSWMDQLTAALAPAAKETPKAPAARKSARSKG
jgi:hypothetical protein